MAWHEVTQIVSKCVYEFKKQMEKRQEHQLNMVLGNFSKLQEELKLVKEELDRQKALAWEQQCMQPPPISSQQEVHATQAESPSEFVPNQVAVPEPDAVLLHSVQAAATMPDEPVEVAFPSQPLQATATMQDEHVEVAFPSQPLQAAATMPDEPVEVAFPSQPLQVRDSSDEACSGVAETVASSSRSDIEEDVRDLRQQLEALREKHLNLARGNIMLHGRVDSLHKNFANHDKLIKFVWEKMPDEDSANEDEVSESESEDEVSESESEDEAQEDETMMVQDYEPEYE